jgi:hypothetical protein
MHRKIITDLVKAIHALLDDIAGLPHEVRAAFGGAEDKSVVEALAAVKRAETTPDPAAIYGIANSLDVAAQAFGKEVGDASAISDCYGGQDGYFRACMEVACIFEYWACAHVDFARMSDIYVYRLQDNFAAALKQTAPHGLNILLELEQFKPEHCLQVAKNLNLPLLQ